MSGRFPPHGDCPMRLNPLPIASLAVALLAPAAHAEIWSAYGINGNDTGGIIPWSPALRAYGYQAAAQDHCGGFVGFSCEFPRNYDPVKSGAWWMRGIL